MSRIVRSRIFRYDALLWTETGSRLEDIIEFKASSSLPSIGEGIETVGRLNCMTEGKAVIWDTIRTC